MGWLRGLRELLGAHITHGVIQRGYTATPGSPICDVCETAKNLDALERLLWAGGIITWDWGRGGFRMAIPDDSSLPSEWIEPAEGWVRGEKAAVGAMVARGPRGTPAKKF